MHTVSFLDLFIIVSYLVFSLFIAVIFSKRAGKNTKEFFLSGRNLPWWIAGTAMVATTFAADTPLAVTELVAKNGIAGNWLWWNMLFGGMLTVFFFARLWRRAGILTDVEFTELRYSGKAAAFLRGFRAIYLGLFMNVIILGWVNLAMVKIISVMFPDLTFFGIKSFNILGMEFTPQLLWVGVILVIVAVYSSLSGLWGVAITDTFQFFLAMTVYSVYWGSMVGILVPWCRTGRWRICGTANDVGEGRETFSFCYSVVHDRSLCLETLAVDNSCARIPGSLS